MTPQWALPAVVDQVADHHGAAGQPGQQPGGVVVGVHHHVAVALVPVGEAVAREGRHDDVDRQQVVAGLNPVCGHVFGEELGRHPLADWATVHVGEGDHDGVDGPVGDASGQQFESGHPA